MNENEYWQFRLNNLQTRMDKCTNEQFWVVTTILAINAVFLTSDLIKDEIEVFKGLLMIFLLILISIYGIWFVNKRHKSYYLYRKEMSIAVKSIEAKLNVTSNSILSKQPKKYSLNTLSGVIFYVVLIVLSTLISIVFISSSMISTLYKNLCV